MASVKNLCFFNLTFGTCAMQWKEDFSYMIEVLLALFAKYDHFVEVNKPNCHKTLEKITSMVR